MNYLKNKIMQLDESAGTAMVKAGLLMGRNAVRHSPEVLIPVVRRSARNITPVARKAVTSSKPLMSRGAKRSLLAAGSVIPGSMVSSALADPHSNSAKLGRKIRYGVDNYFAGPLNAGFNLVGITDEEYPASDATEEFYRIAQDFNEKYKAKK